ncbi:SAM-dependent methyltransferase [Streptosporangium album]|uniref:SAM-dependent methyltransferase n=1 Tax=Streptosporangium album TaxID=47479 RepID=A0A7W7W8Z7_9ACTN|nr:class I SAM-dependent methyltransferase [Streptosporangium album]MBB4938847.1 SAM-dependent methyltransferase [Streptosporangium album]
MTVRVQEHSGPPDTRKDLGRGMEQFHHPRPVCTGRGSESRPTWQRERLLAGLSGRVLEIGAGDGVKLTCFPSGVDEIVLVEPDPFLRAAAQLAAATTSTPVRIRDGALTRLPVPDASCDAVVCSLVLCCAARPETALSEVRRVLRPGGELRFYEHRRSGNPVVALIESVSTPLWARLCGGCHPARDIVAVIDRAGFQIDRLDRLSFHRVDHVLGVARAR